MDAQTQLVAELYKTLNDAQKQEVCNMIDTLLSQQLNDQQSLDSHLQPRYVSRPIPLSYRHPSTH